MFVCNFSNRVDVRNITIRISESLQIDSTGIFLNCTFYRFQIMSIYESCRYTEMGKCML